MKKKKHILKTGDNKEFDAELVRMYMMGATNPGFSNKIEQTGDVVDLHFEKTQVGKGKIEPGDALFIQLDNFEAALDRAIGSGKLEFRVVHGLGKGKLKQEISKFLKNTPT